MVKIARLFVSIGALSTAVAVAVYAGAVLWECQGSLTRALWIGRPLIEVQAPDAGAVLPQGGLLVRVRYPDAARVASETLRCELNGQDVTDRVALRAENGADGAIYPLREGVNRLRIGVFGKGLWGNWVEDVVEVEVRARSVSDWDRA